MEQITIMFITGLVLGGLLGAFIVCCCVVSKETDELDAMQKLEDIERHIKSYNRAKLDDKTKVILDTILLIKDEKVKVVKDDKVSKA